MYKEEFPQDSYMFAYTISKLTTIIHTLLDQASSATSSSDLVPSYILDTIANVLEALRFNRTRGPFDETNLPFEEMKVLTEQVVNLIDLYLVQVYLETQIVGEKPVYVNAGYFSTKGQRILARNMLTNMSMDGTEAKAILPDGMIDNIGVVFQTMTTMLTNPFNWGFEDSGVQVSSQALTISFRYSENKSEVQISDLPEDELIQLWIPKNEDSTVTDDTVVRTDLVYMYLTPNQSVHSSMNISSLLMVGYAVQIEIKAVNAESEDYNVMAYLGYGYRPSWDKYDDVLSITTDASDHANYTFFIYNK